MARGRIRFVWPTPGLPAFLQGEDRFTAIVAQEGADAEVLRNWTQRIALRGVDEGIPIPLEVEAIEPYGSAGADPLISGFAALGEARRFSFARIILRASQPLMPTPPRRVRLYDVLVDGQVERTRSVAAFVPYEGKLMLAFVADLHLAEAWDAIADAVDRYAPDLAAGLLRPKRLLEQFIGEANSLAAQGQLDLVVFGGDLVDHVCPHSHNGVPGTLDDSNVQVLLNALAPLQVPSITIPGNHDYRLYPWRPRTYGLQAVGIPASRTKVLLQRAGLWSRWPICLADLHALRTDEIRGRSALEHYLTQVAPATDFSLILHGVRLMFVSTGRDVISQWRDVEFARSGLLLRSLSHAWLHPDSEGCSDAQVAQIASWLQTPGGAAIFFHAPLLRVSNPAGVGRRVGRVDPGADDNLTTRIAFELRLKRAGMRNGVCFRNAEPLLRALAAARGPAVTFSGHVHQASAIQLDRTDLVLQTVDLAPPTDPAQTVIMLTAPALGQVPIGNHQPPGYFLAHFEGGALVSLDRRLL
ncbi:MAG: metallophosphoesterase [Thermoguttaceae bacterium]